MNQLIQKSSPESVVGLRRTRRLRPLCFVSDSTRNEAKRIFDLLSKEPSDLSAAEFEEVKRLIEESELGGYAYYDERNLLNVVNWDGFTLLQRAVIKNHLAVVKILVKKGCDVNSGICSLPLHLACRLGHVQIAQVLLSHGARADLECTVCYPEEHKLKTCPDQIHCLAYQPVYTPILYALCGDNSAILPLVLTHEASRSLVKTDFLLHEACKMCANSCTQYLLQSYPEQLSQENCEGKTPLQISLVKDADSAIFLVQHGAKLSETVFLTPDTGSTLHELYKSKTTLGLVKATKFAVENGFRSHINARDQDGNTALYVLLRHVGRTVKSSIQSEYDREVQESIKLLLHHGANPNIPNHVGENALHAALADNSVRQLYVSRHGQVRRLKAILQEIYKVSEILLAHGADAGQRSMTPACVSPLYYAVRIFQSLQPEMFVVVQTALKQLFVLLCRDSCNVNATDACGLTVYAQLLIESHRWIAAAGHNMAGSAGVAAFSKTVLGFLTFMLQHFLRHGMNANACLKYWTPRMDESVSSNYFKEVLIFTTLQVNGEVTFYDSVRQLLIKLIQRGGNPNRLIFTTPPSLPPKPTSTPTCCPLPSTLLSRPVSRNSELVYILLRAIYTQPVEILPSLVQILRIFRRTLRRGKLNEFTAALYQAVAADFSSHPLPAPAWEEMKEMGEVPRSLKELSRLEICCCLDWRGGKRCSSLPLPKPLLQYLLNYDL